MSAAQMAPDKIDFWDTRECLAHIRNTALATRTAPWAVLGTVLARVLAATPPSVQLPDVIGDYGSLNLYVALVAPAGGGKDNARRVGAKAVIFVDERGEPIEIERAELATGQGITGVYKGRRTEDQPSLVGGPVEKIKDVLYTKTDRALFTSGEIGELAAYSSQAGANVISTLTAAWMASDIGGAVKDAAKYLPMPDHSYRLCWICGVQPLEAHVIMSKATAGLPQRILWMPATGGRTVGYADRPERPEPRKIKLLGHPTIMDICDRAVSEIEADADRRDAGEGDPLDTHLMFGRMKIAGALALLAERTEINDQDWTLAGTITDVSLRTRAGVAARLAERTEQEEMIKRERNSRTLIHGENALARDRTVRQIRSVLDDHEWHTERDIGSALGPAYRPDAESVRAELLAAGEVVTRTAGKTREWKIK